jgi:hypothetical protein
MSAAVAAPEFNLTCWGFYCKILIHIRRTQKSLMGVRNIRGVPLAAEELEIWMSSLRSWRIVVRNMLSRDKGRPFTHWSKEYVEHLRTVHFALIAVCSGLLILMLSANQNQENAIRQLRELISIQKRWDPYVFPADMPRADKLIDPQPAGILMPWSVSSPLDLILIDGDKRSPIELKFPAKNYVISYGHSSDQQTGHRSESPENAPNHVQTFPSSVGELASWWNAMLGAQFVYPMQMSESALRRAGPGRDDKEIPLEVLTMSDHRLGPPPVVQALIINEDMTPERGPIRIMYEAVISRSADLLHPARSVLASGIAMVCWSSR